jgi:oligosaccharyltransferase complex subunit alpha (ribophorin I)
VKNFKTVLPAAASDVYYRDDIGNISTSALRVLDDAVELELRPRFPLFGGWKTHYFIGYSVPSYEYLFTNGNNYVLNMRLLDHVYDDMLVEQFTLKIILPEGCQVGKFHSPYPTSRKGDALHFTYLDTKGRPVVNIENIGVLTEKHIQDFQLEFIFPKSFMIHEPLLLVIAFFIFFALTIVYVRLDFAITKDEGTEAKMKVAGICEKVLALQEKRNNNYAQFDEALSKLKSSKDNATFQASLKKINNDHKTETQSIADVIPYLKAISVDVAEKVGEIQKLDRTFRENQQMQAALVDKLVTGKLPKPQFIEQETVLNKKRSEVQEKIQSICVLMRSI